MKNKPYSLIWAKMTEYGYQVPDLADALGRGTTYTSLRLNGKESWTQRDMYIIMDLFNIPYSEMYRYFPQRGMWKEAI